MASLRDAAPYNPFPVAPENVPEVAVRALMHTAARKGRPMDREDAQLYVAMVIAALVPPADRKDSPDDFTPGCNCSG